MVVGGPEDSPFKGGTFKLGEYSMAAPEVHFIIKMYYLNADKLERIHLDILKARAWSRPYAMNNT